MMDEARSWAVGERAPTVAYLNALEAVAHAARETRELTAQDARDRLDEALARLDRTLPYPDRRIVI